jgi:transcriptional antiterminator RfaH
MSIFKRGWYLIYTRPQHEKKVACELVEKNLSFLLATTKVLRKWHDRNKLIDAPLFPSYIFVFLANVVDYHTSIEIEGVVNYVKFGKEIAIVKENIVTNLKALLDCGTNIELSANRFEIGQQVKITQGCLTGLSCEIAEYRNEKKILVRISLLNRTVLAAVPLMNLAQC